MFTSVSPVPHPSSSRVSLELQPGARTRRAAARTQWHALAFWPEKSEETLCPAVPACSDALVGRRSELSVLRAQNVLARQLRVTAEWCSFRRRAVHTPSGLHVAGYGGVRGSAWSVQHRREARAGPTVVRTGTWGEEASRVSSTLSSG